MEKKLGCDACYREIYEYNVLTMQEPGKGIPENSDPRDYCVVVADDGKAYAISVNDDAYKRRIRKYENIPQDKEIETKVKPLSEMTGYFVTIDSYGEEYVYGEECMSLQSKWQQEIKDKLNEIIAKNGITTEDSNTKTAKQITKRTNEVNSKKQ